MRVREYRVRNIDIVKLKMSPSEQLVKALLYTALPEGSVICDGFYQCADDSSYGIRVENPKFEDVTGKTSLPIEYMDFSDLK